PPRAAAEVLAVGAAEGVGARVAAGEGDGFDVGVGGGEHGAGLVEAQAAEQRAGRLAVATGKLADEVLATDAAFFGDALEVDRRAKVAAQVVVAELDGVAGAGAVNLFTVEGDEQAVDQLGLVEMVAEGAPGKALMEFAVKRAGLGGVGQADDRAEIPPQAVEQRSEAGDVYGHITQSIRFGGVLRVTVGGGLVVGEKHGVAGRHVVRAAVVGKPT